MSSSWFSCNYFATIWLCVAKIWQLISIFWGFEVFIRWDLSKRFYSLFKLIWLLIFTHIWQLINYVLTFYRFHSSELTFLFVTQTPRELICSWAVNLWISFPLRLRNLLKCSPIKPPATHRTWFCLMSLGAKTQSYRESMRPLL